MRSDFDVLSPPAQSLIGWLLIFAGCLTIYNACATIRLLYFHPLSKIPGPKLWAASRLPYVIALLKGNLIYRMDEFHAKYGNTIRVGPNEVSFAKDEAWKDIYMFRPGHKEAKKDPVWYIAPNDMPQNIVTTTDTKTRARMRKCLTPSFTNQALHDQRFVLQSYADKFMDQLKKATSEGGIVNMLDWVNYFTVDIIGDLAVGESFGCLEGKDYHPWVRTLYNFLKGMQFAAAMRFYPSIESLFMKLFAGPIIKKQMEHTSFTNNLINKRLELKTNRPDFLTPFLRENRNYEMSLGELQSTFAIIIVAGSETTATSLCGTISRLVHNPEKQRKLATVLRKHFAKEEDITMDSTKGITYLDAVINEGLRTCYAVPGGLPRVVPQGGDVYAGQYLPGGTSISIRPHSMLFSEKYFKHANEFHPERWLPKEQRPRDFLNDNLAASQPFSVGPTNCMGKPLAWAEMRLILARLFWYFEVEAVPDKPFVWEKQKMVMTVEKDPLWLKLRPRDG